jgi:hypothetical protein
MTDQQLLETCAELHNVGAWPGPFADLLDRLEQEIEQAADMCTCGHCGEREFLAIAVSAIVDERSREAVWN